MRANQIPFAIAALAVAAATPAQHNVQIGHMLVVQVGAPCTWNQILQTFRSENTTAALERACADADLRLVQVRFEPTPISNPEEQRRSESLQSFELWFTIHAELGAVPTTEIKSALYEKVIADIQRRLDSQTVDRLRATRLQRLEHHEAEAGTCSARIAELRSQIGSMRAPTTASIRTNLTELERKRLDTDLDLRTEEATQHRVQALLAETSKAVDGNATQRDVALENRDRLDQEFRLLSARTNDDAEGRQRLADLGRRVAEVKNQLSRLQQEFDRLVAMSSALAEDARRSTLACHRLTARKRVLEELLAEQNQLLEVAIQAEAERSRLEDELAKRIATHDEAEARARQCRDQLAELEPVRLQIWK